MMLKHSVCLFGHATSFSLEEEFWQELKDISYQRGISLTKILETLDSQRLTNLSSAIRVFVLNEVKKSKK